MPGLEQASEFVLVQELVSHPPVEALDVRVLDGLSGPDEVQFHPALAGPRVEHSAGELRPVVHGDDLGKPSELTKSLEYTCDAAPVDAGVHLDGQALPGEVVDDVQEAEPPSALQRIEHEVHRPALVGAHRRFGCNAQSRRHLLPSLPWAEGEAFFAIEPQDALVVHLEAFTPKQDVEALVSEARALGCKFLEALPELGNLLPSAPVAKRRAPYAG